MKSIISSIEKQMDEVKKDWDIGGALNIHKAKKSELFYRHSTLQILIILVDEITKKKKLGRSRKYLDVLEVMNIGDSIDIPVTNLSIHKLQVSVLTSARNIEDRKFKTSTTIKEGNLRVWRIK